MMKSTIKASTYRAIYRLLDRVSPVDYDCGNLCDARCCTVSGGSKYKDEDLGIYLLPGEEKIHDKKDDWIIWSSEPAEDYEFPKSWKGNVYFIRCKNPPCCPREKRPIQCRTFPLLPHIDEEGELYLVYNDVDLPYKCPLIEDEIPLEERFIQATYTAWKHLIEDPLIYDLVKADSEAREGGIKELYEKLF